MFQSADVRQISVSLRVVQPVAHDKGVGALKAGSFPMQIAESIPIDIVSVIQGVVVLFIAAPPLVRAIFGLPQPGRTSRRSRRAAAKKKEVSA